MYKELSIKDIKSSGWIKDYLNNQLSGLTGNMDKIDLPFSGAFWENTKITYDDLPKDAFLGGIIALDDAWVPFEQNGYWIDGLVRCGILTENKEAIEKAKSKMMPSILNPDKDGYIGPSFLKDKITWAHSIYFRSLVALYEYTKDKRIIDALKNHYLRCPLKDVFEKQKNSARIVYVRNIADIEVALWLYGKTNDKRFLLMSEESYKEFNKVFESDKGASIDSLMHDLTLKGMLGNKKVNKNHGVTYLEICKLPAILYEYTGKEIYKRAAINAFEKLYRDQMIIDGVNSSTEYLNGNQDSHAMHETCDISDLTWALGYLYMITGDAKYGDRIENAIFNAGLGAVDDDFKGEQYFSCPNQVICDDVSNHAYFYRGQDWMSYAPKKFLACCAGNVHRFMPNYVARSWFFDERNNELYAALYCPSTIKFKNIRIKEETLYPFSNNICFRFDSNANIKFAFRIPSWAKTFNLKINGKKAVANIINNKCTLTNGFKKGDCVEISFEDEISFIKNAKGVSIKKGPLLYALPIEEIKVVNGLRMLENKEFPHYSLYPVSKWNYALNLTNVNVMVTTQTIKREPWKKNHTGLSIKLNAYELPSWKLINSNNGKMRLNPRGKIVSIGHKCQFMPKVKAISKKELGAKRVIKLVPYCSTTLRITIFPFIVG